MRRAILAGLALGLATGLLFVYHETLSLTVVWPVVLGFALWEAVGRRGMSGLGTAAAAAVGVGAGYLAFAVVAEYLPITNLWLGVTAGTAVGLMVLVGALAGHRFPMAGMLVGFGAFAGMFTPLWEESPAAVRSHGIETVTVALLGVLIGVLLVTLVRSVSDRVEAPAEAEPAARREPSRPATEGRAS